MPSVTVDRAWLERFRRAYRDASGDVFTFEGLEYLKDYAKYLIEYLEGRFGK